MARKARARSSMGTYNIILCGKAGLFREDADYEHFLELMDKYISDVYGFSLTENTVCMAAGESEKGISMDLKPLITSYARYYNKKYNTDGKVFDGRFKSEPIESRKELENSAALAAAIPDITGKEGYVSENGKEYEMISFYAPVAGTVKKKAAPKKAEVRAEKKKKKNMPSWLL
ncbi:MAG: hypothetical protein PUF72_09280 [Clostridiales bacterium]|nr:hypothetical protein [Clostridiales bacterium]